MSLHPFLEGLDRDNDEDGVRSRLAAPHGYQESYKPLVREWLREQESKRSSAAKEEANSIARSAAFAATAAAFSASEANPIARRANRIAFAASIIAAIAVISAIVIAVVSK